MLDAPASNVAALKTAQAPTSIPVMDTTKPKIEPITSTASTEASSVPRKESPAQKPEVKATPPPASYHPPPPRPDINRADSSSALNSRTQHNLPSKPDIIQPRAGDHRSHPRTGDRGPHDLPRDPRYPDRGEPRDLLRDRGLDRSLSGPYPHGSLDRDRLDQRWSNDKAPPGRPDIENRHGEQPMRDARYPVRDERTDRPLGDKPYLDQQQSRRDMDLPRQPPRDIAMPPPRPTIPPHPINPERAALIQGQTPDRGQPSNVHPERRHGDLSRQDDLVHPERKSRGPSPTRTDDRRSSRYNDRPPIDGRRPLEDASHSVPPRSEESHAPKGPRTGGRLASVGSGPSNPNDRFRESMKQSHNMPPHESTHGRLSNHDSNFGSRQPESQYGRLNPDNDIPSGPRLANGNHPPPQRGGRNISAPQPQLNTQLPSQSQAPATPNQERQTPSGPSLRGSPRKQPPFPNNVNTSSAPPTPVNRSPDTAGIHPDRLKALQGAGAVATETPPQNRAGVRQQPLSVSMPPRGPNNNQLPSPIGPPVGNRGPPTGPSLPNDRSGRDKRTIAGIQNVLQQAGSPGVPERAGQGASIRGRGGRANNVNGPSPIASAPPTPGLSRPDYQPSREDLFAGRANGSLSQMPEDDSTYGRGGRRGAAEEGPRDGDRRSDRHRSRSPGMDRHAGQPHRPREADLGQGREDFRDHRGRGNDGPLDRDMRGAGPFEAQIRGGGGAVEGDRRDRGQGRDGRRRDDGQYRDREQREGGDRRDDRDRRDGGGSVRKRGRGEDGQGERSFSDNKRPRR